MVSLKHSSFKNTLRINSSWNQKLLKICSSIIFTASLSFSLCVCFFQDVVHVCGTGQREKLPPSSAAQQRQGHRSETQGTEGGAVPAPHDST